MPAEQFTESVVRRLKQAGIDSVELLDVHHFDGPYGDVEAVFRLGPMILKFIRDRGQEFLNMAASSEPQEFFFFSEIEMAMGWRTVDEIVTPWNPSEVLKPEEMDSILLKLKGYLPELGKAFSGDRERFTRVRLAEAKVKRQAAAMKKLRNIKPNARVDKIE